MLRAKAAIGQYKKWPIISNIARKFYRELLKMPGPVFTGQSEDTSIINWISLHMARALLKRTGHLTECPKLEVFSAT